MPRHSTALKDYDDYYDDNYDEYDDYDDYYPSTSTINKNNSKSSSSSSSSSSNNNNKLGDFVIKNKQNNNQQTQKNKQKNNNNNLKAQPAPKTTITPSTITATTTTTNNNKQGSTAQQNFIQQAKEILGSVISDDELIDVFTRHSGNSERALSSLLDRISSSNNTSSTSPVNTPLKSIKDDIPPGFSTNTQSPSVVKSSKPPTPIPAGITSIGKKQSKVERETDNISPSRGNLSQNKSPIVSTLPLTPPPISRSSSGQLNRATALSDDELDEIITPSSTKPSLPHITMVVAGHVDAGKSTLVGNFLLKIGSVSSRTVGKYKTASQAQGKGSFYLAWVMDESESEREHGVTIGVAERHFQTDVYDFTILDAPGHRDFIPNMITGASQADVALLVVPASAGEYETSMGVNAQTREHAVLLKALGVNQVIIVVNKMDTTSPPWSQSRFNEIQTDIKKLLVELQFGPKAIRCVPVSSLEDVNLVPSQLNSLNENERLLREWYQGPTLLEMINTFKEPPRQIQFPLRASITTLISESPKGYEVKVKVLQGRLRRGRGIAIPLIQGAFDVRKIMKEDGTLVETLFAGEMGTIHFVDRSNRSYEEIKLRENMIIYKGPCPPPVSRIFKATILTLSPLVPPIIPGSSYELYLHGHELQCNIRKIYSIMVGNDIIKNPKCVGGNQCAVIRIETTETICIEEFSLCRSLGRFALRSKGQTYAVGICDRIVPYEGIS